jgi:peptidoglycan LD-endopeptidase LytH
MPNAADFNSIVKKYMSGFHSAVPFEKGKDNIVLMDFTDRNKSLTTEVLSETNVFSAWVENYLEEAGALYGIGGYNEHRTIYKRSDRFDPTEGDEPRRLHLGIDIWGKAGTPIYAPLEGTVHSFSFNDYYGDYGATLILQHDLDGLIFHTLYGHLSLASINDKKEGEDVMKGDWIAAFGEPAENGHWPPHLHFQVIFDMQGMKGDFPGVCKFSEREKFLANSPDPDLILDMMKFAGQA